MFKGGYHRCSRLWCEGNSTCCDLKVRRIWRAYLLNRHEQRLAIYDKHTPIRLPVPTVYTIVRPATESPGCQVEPEGGYRFEGKSAAAQEWCPSVTLPALA
jgi:hypothetical protein